MQQSDLSHTKDLNLISDRDISTVDKLYLPRFNKVLAYMKSIYHPRRFQITYNKPIKKYNFFK